MQSPLVPASTILGLGTNESPRPVDAATSSSMRTVTPATSAKLDLRGMEPPKILSQARIEDLTIDGICGVYYRLRSRRDQAPGSWRHAAALPHYTTLLRYKMDTVPHPDFGQAYGFSRGFSFRREAFGGILYHYQGTKPDPRITFVDNVFLIDLLARIDDRPLEDLIAGVGEHFGLTSAEDRVVRRFFATLIANGALVERSQACEPCGVPAMRGQEALTP
jgi:mycofactocin precursor